jgi:hypothetical protein
VENVLNGLNVKHVDSAKAGWSTVYNNNYLPVIKEEGHSKKHHARREEYDHERCFVFTGEQEYQSGVERQGQSGGPGYFTRNNCN